VKRVLGKKRQKDVRIRSTSNTDEGRLASMEKTGQYHSVEVCPNATAVPHLFKIWHMNTMSMVILIREDSSLLPYLHEGDRLEMIYYPSPSAYPSERLETIIKQISRDEQGRYKGHFLVGLAVVREQRKGKIRKINPT
jgi:hypothetical protein